MPELVREPSTCSPGPGARTCPAPPWSTAGAGWTRFTQSSIAAMADRHAPPTLDARWSGALVHDNCKHAGSDSTPDGGFTDSPVHRTRLGRQTAVLFPENPRRRRVRRSVSRGRPDPTRARYWLVAGAIVEGFGDDLSCTVPQIRRDLHVRIKRDHFSGNPLALRKIDAPDQPLEMRDRRTRHG